MAIRNGNCSGSHNCINKSIGTERHGNVIDPDIGGTDDGHSISITVMNGPDSTVVHRVSDTSTAGSNNVMNANSLNDNTMDDNASTVRNLYMVPTPINRPRRWK
ncbi:hypothetical protein OIU76_019086 [Salix suchowensis]|nr:hypothetical protein OIU76_019086 [Salix suchowensis]